MTSHGAYVTSTTRATWEVRVPSEAALRTLSRRLKADPHVDKVEHWTKDLILLVSFKPGYGAPFDTELAAMQRYNGQPVVEPPQPGRKGRKGRLSKSAYEHLE